MVGKIDQHVTIILMKDKIVFKGKYIKKKHIRIAKRSNIANVIVEFAKHSCSGIGRSLVIVKW